MKRMLVVVGVLALAAGGWAWGPQARARTYGNQFYSQMQWRPIGPLRPWLFKIMINLYRNDRRRQRGSLEQETLDVLPFEPATPATQGARLALAETAAALERLPAEQREALLLVALEGMSYAEAASALDIPQGTLMSRISRAREALRAMVDGQGPKLRSVK